MISYNGNLTLNTHPVLQGLSPNEFTGTGAFLPSVDRVEYEFRACTHGGNVRGGLRAVDEQANLTGGVRAEGGDVTEVGTRIGLTCYSVRMSRTRTR